jgi:hypothetical protein
VSILEKMLRPARSRGFRLVSLKGAGSSPAGPVAVFMRKLRLPGISGRPFAPRDFVSKLSIIAGHPNGKPDE